MAVVRGNGALINVLAAGATSSVSNIAQTGEGGNSIATSCADMAVVQSFDAFVDLSAGASIPGIAFVARTSERSTRV